MRYAIICYLDDQWFVWRREEGGWARIEGADFNAQLPLATAYCLRRAREILKALSPFTQLSASLYPLSQN